MLNILSNKRSFLIAWLQLSSLKNSLPGTLEMDCKQELQHMWLKCWRMNIT